MHLNIFEPPQMLFDVFKGVVFSLMKFNVFGCFSQGFAMFVHDSRLFVAYKHVSDILGRLWVCFQFAYELAN